MTTVLRIINLIQLQDRTLKLRPACSIIIIKKKLPFKKYSVGMLGLRLNYFLIHFAIEIMG